MWRSITLLVVLFLLVGGITWWLFSSASAVDESEEKKAATEKTKPTPATTTVVRVKANLPSSLEEVCKEIKGVWHCQTPATIQINFGFDIGNTEPLRVEVPGEEPVTLIPGANNRPLNPNSRGAKVFKKPEGSTKEVSFRIYPK